MVIQWDTIQQLREASELTTMIIELIIILAAISNVFALVYLRKNYPKFTKKGFIELFVGFTFITLHFFFDLLDTLVTKKSDGETVFIYTLFDMLDAIFSFLGLFIVGFAFYKIAKYGMELWEGKEE
ncbi:hypothetical protein [Candidatus Lokiarchaeum ossiferum]|uniref:hypothetical protein n=1 Tax=Candidatus Lokiarchaeum ossiferum TaxID=2951803 RepID=UPI00352F4BCD